MALADIPGYGAYIERKRQNEQKPLAELQQATGAIGLLSKLQEAQQAQQMRQLMADSGGDPEKAMEAALRVGNAKAAQELAPVLKLYQEKKSREQTPQLLADLNRQFGPQAQAEAQPQELGIGQPISQAGASPVAAAPESPLDARQRRIAHLTSLSMIPQYANNPVVAQRLQAEIDKLTNVKPMVEHQFSVGGDQVQPHISFDEGRTWQPVPGSKPSAKFAKQVEPVAGAEPSAQPTADTLEMDAWRYLTDGTLPPNMGRGVQGTQQATGIRNRAAALAKEMGMTPDEIRMAQLTNKTQVAAIGQLAKSKAQILQFEKTAEYNADLALKASEEVWRTGSPLINKPLQWLRSEGAGDPKAKVFNAANETFVSEYARVMSGGYGAAQTTEGAQNRAHQLLSTASTKEQYQKVVDQLRAEMKNRVRALETQMAEERQNLRSGVVRKPAASPTAAPGAAPSVESLLEKYK